MTRAPKSFTVRADRIPVGGLDISEVLSVEFLSELVFEGSKPLTWQAVEGAEVQLHLMPEATMIRLTGGGKFVMATPCIRCMHQASFAVTLDFNTRLMPGQAELEADGTITLESFSDDVPVQEEEFVVSYYQDGIIDISALLREQLFLDLPDYPTCCELPAVFGAEEMLDGKIRPFAALAGMRSKLLGLDN